MTIGVDEGAQHGGFRDMALWRGRLCALGHDGAVLAFRADLGARAAAVSLLRDAEHQLGALGGGWWQLYLVENDGELLVVRKLYKVGRNGGDVDWEVEVRLLASPEQRRWDLLVETPGQALFVGSVVSAVVPVALYAAAGLRESCVYFARRDVERLAPHAICEYSLLDEEMRGVPVAGGHAVDVEPVWITPFII
uniref:KIB1-4 beta-propeller domain-containing protein n=1 Tax=Arundo donax TaxID=35708 RepID=A0A0A9ERT4_ARUDO